MHHVLVRPATAADHSRLLQVQRAAVEATHLFLTVEDIDGYEVLVREYLPRIPQVEVAELDDGTVAGFVAHDAAHIHMLFVDPHLHGRGVGTVLLEQAAAGAPRVSVEVNEQNPSARDFYAARGFRVVARSELDGQGRPFPLLHLQRP